MRTWPQLAVQPYIDGFDLAQSHHDQATAPSNVWLVNDGLGPSVTGFERMLTHDGYFLVGTRRVPGVLMDHFHRGSRLYDHSSPDSVR